MYEKRRAEVAARSAADAHRECVENDKKGAIAARRSRRTHHRWRTAGFGSPLYEAQLYILRVDDPFRAVGSMMAAAKQAVLTDKTVGQLQEDFQGLIELRASAQAEIARLMAHPIRNRSTAIALASAEERAAGLSAEIAGVLRELQSRPGAPTPWSD